MKKLILVFASVILVAGGVVLAANSIPSPDGTIYACYKNNNGQLRVVDDPQECLNSETAIFWSQSGVPGPQGPAGGLSDVTYAFADSVTADQMFASATAQCPTGTLATGGGWAMIGTIGVESNLDSFLVIANVPTDGTGWQVSIRRSGPTRGSREWGVRTFAICAL
ncbi:hypothetical protein KKC00_01025 [Patescibacteria group bacterium]|nr:hypothetical protein [Patescibacteria group bacterium]